MHANSTAPLYTSTHANREDQDDKDHIAFLSDHDIGFYSQIKDLDPPVSPRIGDSYMVSLTSVRLKAPYWTGYSPEASRY